MRIISRWIFLFRKLSYWTNLADIFKYGLKQRKPQVKSRRTGGLGVGGVPTKVSNVAIAAVAIPSTPEIRTAKFAPNLWLTYAKTPSNHFYLQDYMARLIWSNLTSRSRKMKYRSSITIWVWSIKEKRSQFARLTNRSSRNVPHKCSIWNACLFVKVLVTKI